MSNRLRAIPVVFVAVVLIVVAAVSWSSRGDDAAPAPSADRTTAAQEPEPTGWVPSDEVQAKAKQLADSLSLDDLAGQLIIARSFSNDSSLALVRDKHFAGVMVTGQQILDVTT